MGDGDRNAILRRRAVFLGSALAALGSCARTAPPPEHGDPVVAVPPPASDDAGVTSEPAGDAALPGRGSGHSGPTPPLVVPANVSERAKQNYEHMVRTYTAAYRLLDEMEAGMPTGCSINDSKCESKWRALAEKNYELDGVFRFYHICPGSSQEAKDFAALDKEHGEYYAERYKRIQASVDGALHASGGGAVKKWEQMKWDVQKGKPQVCLSFGCMDW